MNRVYPHPFIAREGWPVIGLALAAALVVQFFFGGLLSAIFWLAFVFVLQFFRDPAREMTNDPAAVVSPADGRVIKVEECTCPYTGEEAKRISIFMNVFSVHSQKFPVSGTIEDVEYFAGRFFNASLDKASEQNERNAVVIATESGRRVCFVQIAGLVARRVLFYKRIGDEAVRGERCGFIRFGSRVDVYLPLNAEVGVTIGEKVTGVKTVLARMAG